MGSTIVPFPATRPALILKLLSIMCSRIWVRLIAALLLYFWAHPLSADERFAFVVGNASYDHAPRLRTPLNDAFAVKQKLIERGYHVAMGQNLTRNAFVSMVKSLLKNLEKAPDPTVLFYFAGHGTELDGDNHLVAIDASFESEEKARQSLIPVSEIARAFMSKSARVIMVIDACRDRAYEAAVQSQRQTRGIRIDRRTLALRELPDHEKSAFSSFALKAAKADTLPAQMPPLRSYMESPGTYFIFSTLSGFTALDQLHSASEHSPFAELFLKHLDEKKVDIGIFSAKVNIDLRDATRRSGGMQVVDHSDKLEFPLYYLGGE